MKKIRTIAIGIDSGDLEYMEPLMKANELPNIECLKNRGGMGYLKSVFPCQTHTAWMSIITGLNPGKHGVFDLQIRSNYDFVGSVNANQRMNPPFWRYLNKIGLKVGLFNVPLTYPPEEINGFIVAGFPDAPKGAADVTFPEDLYRDIINKYRNFSLDALIDIRIEKGPGEYLESCRRRDLLAVDAALWLIEKYDIDFFMMNNPITDHLNHHSKDYKYVEESYKVVDFNIGRFMKKFPESNFIIFSDHGSRRFSDHVPRRIKSKFFINKWLYKNGYLVLKQKKYSELNKGDLNEVIHKLLLQNLKIKGLQEKLIRRLIVCFFMAMKPWCWGRIWDYLSQRYPSVVNEQKCVATVDPEKTSVFSRMVGTLYFNRQGDNSRLQLSETLKQKLMKIVNPDSGKKVHFRIYDAGEIYSGEKTNDSPDLIIDFGKGDCEWHDKIYNFDRDSEENYFGERLGYGFYGAHRQNGVIILSGPAFKTTGIMQADSSILDLTPTFLHLNRIEKPDNFDGRVLNEYISKAYLYTLKEKRKIVIDDHEKRKNTHNTNEEEAEEVKNRLRSLGYIG